MPYRPYPNADRARRQLDRRHVQQPVQPSELTLKLAAQANAALKAVGVAVQPMVDALNTMGAPDPAPLAVKVAVVMGRQLEADLAQTAPGLFTLHRMAQSMRRPA